MALYALDIETVCNVASCDGKHCDHALDEHRNRITCIGIWSPAFQTVFRDLAAFSAWLSLNSDARFVCHNGKFDMKNLKTHIPPFNPYTHWAHDTQLMAFVLCEKVSEEYLAWYQAKRKELNDKLPEGQEHRNAKHHSLKTLAPYFLGVEPFWEATDNHDNDQYVLKDCEYTYKLCQLLTDKLFTQGSYSFYRGKLFEWAKLLLRMELRGIRIDLNLMEKLAEEAKTKAAESLDTLTTKWADAFREYERKQREALRLDYDEKCSKAVLKLKDQSKAPGTVARYDGLYNAAAEKVTPLDLDSPKQVLWLLRDYNGLDITDFDGEESTGKAVLKRLAGEGHEDIKAFLEYRRCTKLVQAFFPSYREMNVDGTIYATFNPAGPRTGRLSSARPNLQQIERNIKKLFVARPGFKLFVPDMQAIEPRLIAYYTHDKNLYELLARGDDFHGANAKIFCDLTCDVNDVKELHPLEREVGKEIGLLLMYGGGVRRIQESGQKRGFRWTQSECQRKLEKFKKFYSGVYDYRDKVLNPRLTRGEIVTNLLGRPFRIANHYDVHLQGLNTLIQGSASDLVLNAAQRIQATFDLQGLNGHILALEHDAIVGEFHESCLDKCVDVTRNAMTDWYLETPHGQVRLFANGKLADCWSK